MTRSLVPGWFLVSLLWPTMAAAQSGGAPSLTWTPEIPTEGRLFVVQLQVPPGARLLGIRGEAGGEALHFVRTPSGVFESLAPVPVDTREGLEVSVGVSFQDGRVESLSASVPVSRAAYRHERLTVAPRFGSPPDSAARARLARDRARAREVSRQAHATPRLWTADLVLPRADRVTSEFGNGREFNGQISSRHMGLDLDGEPGDTVVAVTRGVVALVDEFLLAGNIVYLNHGGGLLSGYFHLSEQLVSPGDTVVAGTPIGRVGATGRVTGPHLHWVVRYGATSVDPRSLLDVGGGGAP
jgi:murein DD-endopeptidase MepM/ murein hydrolase activator NlpD